MFTDKTAIVTGGSRGIGAACAIKLAKEGADIAIFATSESAKAKETIDVYMPLTRRINNQKLTDELNNLAYKYNV